jgi:hypothetical protein
MLRLTHPTQNLVLDQLALPMNIRRQCYRHVKTLSGDVEPIAFTCSHRWYEQMILTQSTYAFPGFVFLVYSTTW